MGLVLSVLSLALACQSRPSQDSTPTTEVRTVEWILQGQGVLEKAGLLPWAPEQFPTLLWGDKVLYGAGYYPGKQAPKNVLAIIDPADSRGVITAPLDPEFVVSSTQVTLPTSDGRMAIVFTTTKKAVVGAILGEGGWELPPTVLMPGEDELSARVLGVRFTEDALPGGNADRVTSQTTCVLECVLWPNSGFVKGYSVIDRRDPVIVRVSESGPAVFRFIGWDILSRDYPLTGRLGHNEIPLAHFDEEAQAWSFLIDDSLGLREVTLTEPPRIEAVQYPKVEPAPKASNFDKSRLGFTESMRGLDRYLWTKDGLKWRPKEEPAPEGSYGGRTLWEIDPKGSMEELQNFRLANLDYQRFDGRDLAVQQSKDLTSVRSRNENESYPLTPRGAGLPQFNHTTFLPTADGAYWLIDLGNGACRRFRLPELPASSSSESP